MNSLCCRLRARGATSVGVLPFLPRVCGAPVELGKEKIRNFCGLQVAKQSFRFLRLVDGGKCRNLHRASVASRHGQQEQRSCAEAKHQQRSVRSKVNDCFGATASNFHGYFASENSRLLLKHPNKGVHVNMQNCMTNHGFLLSMPSYRGSAWLETLRPRLTSPRVSAENAFQAFRHFHTSPVLKVLLPPHVWLLLKPAQKLFAIILGRSIRKWWKALPSDKQKLFRESLKRSKWKLFASLSGLGIVFILFYFTHLEESPVTGRSRLLVFRKEHYDVLTQLQYDSLMEEYADYMLAKTDPCYQVVQKIFDQLIEFNRDMPEINKMEWILHVVEKSDIDAFVLPNGQVFVFTGLLKAVADTHQLSFILGHEIAHAVLEHVVEQGSVTHLLDFLLLISLIMIWAICPLDSLAIVGQWIQSKLKEFMFCRPYSRTLEAEADKVGLQLAAKACIDVRASSVFWQQMELLEAMKGQPQLPEWLSTHPSHGKRAEHLDRLIPEALKLREMCNCPAISGPDPRLIFRLSMQHLEKSEEKEKPDTMMAPS